MAPATRLDLVIRTIAKHGGMDSALRKWLDENRGLSAAEARAQSLLLLPDSVGWSRVLEELEGVDLSGVPGAFMTRKGWDLVRPTMRAYMQIYENFDGLAIRCLMRGTGGREFAWYSSSGKRNGTEAPPPVGWTFPDGWERCAALHRLCVATGFHKAHAAVAEHGIPCLMLPSETVDINLALQEIQEHAPGLEELVFLTDADRLEKPTVEAFSVNAIEEFRKFAAVVEPRWDEYFRADHSVKGIDDLRRFGLKPLEERYHSRIRGRSKRASLKPARHLGGDALEAVIWSQARQELKSVGHEWVDEVLDPLGNASDLILGGDCGLGKSHCLLQMAQRLAAEGRSVVIAYQSAENIPEGVKRRLGPFNQRFPLCLRTEEPGLKEAYKSGAGLPCSDCVHRLDCGYLEQPRGPIKGEVLGTVFATLKTSPWFLDADVVMIDDGSVVDFLTELRVPEVSREDAPCSFEKWFRYLDSPKGEPWRDARPFLAATEAILRKSRSSPQLLTPKQVTAALVVEAYKELAGLNWQAILADACQAFETQGEPVEQGFSSLTPPRGMKQFVEAFRALVFADHAVNRSLFLVQNHTTKVVDWVLYQAPDFSQAGLMVWADATPDILAIQHHRPGAVYRKPSPVALPENVEIIQKIVRYGKGSQSCGLSQARILKELEDAYAADSAQGFGAPAIQANKALIESEGFKAGIGAKLQGRGLPHHGLRSNNSQKDADLSYCVGTPTKPLDVFAMEAQAVYGPLADAIDTEKLLSEPVVYIDKERGLLESDKPRVTWADERLRSHHWRGTVGEFVQSLHRLRFLTAEIRKRLRAWSEYPLPYPVTLVGDVVKRFTDPGINGRAALAAIVAAIESNELRYAPGKTMMRDAHTGEPLGRERLAERFQHLGIKENQIRRALENPENLEALQAAEETRLASLAADEGGLANDGSYCAPLGAVGCDGSRCAKNGKESNRVAS